MSKEEYYESLKDPRWQKKRLEILERDEWTCQICGAKDKTLHIHHLYYLKTLPWNYPDEALKTLCAYCHEDETTALSDATHDLILIMKQKGWISRHFRELTNLILSEGHKGKGTIPIGDVSKKLMKKIINGPAKETNG